MRCTYPHCMKLWGGCHTGCNELRWDEMVEKLQSISVKFWHSLSNEEWDYVMRTGELDAKLCERLWRLTDRQGPAPPGLTVLVSSKDVKRLVKKARQEIRRRSPGSPPRSA